ncbi:hypothetical protein Tco_0400486 [Tanacetum coccineum]
MLLRPQHVGFGDQSTKFETMSPETMVHQCPLKDLIILMHKADPNYEEIDGGFVAFGVKQGRMLLEKKTVVYDFLK